MDPQQYQREAMRTEASPEIARTKFSPPGALALRLNHASLGLSTEVGEFNTLLKKYLYYGQPLDRVKAQDELGDIVWYVVLACEALNLDFQEVLMSNLRKLKIRFPEKFDQERVLDRNRDREAEQEAMKPLPVIEQ